MRIFVSLVVEAADAELMVSEWRPSHDSRKVAWRYLGRHVLQTEVPWRHLAVLVQTAG